MNIHQALEPASKHVTFNKLNTQLCWFEVQVMLDEQALTIFFSFTIFFRNQ